MLKYAEFSLSKAAYHEFISRFQPNIFLFTSNTLGHKKYYFCSRCSNLRYYNFFF